MYSAAELTEIFIISKPIAKELSRKFANFFDPDDNRSPAIYSYDGVVYKHFKSKDGFTQDQQDYLQSHLRISSLLYGLLRPMDGIKPYRMEGFVRLSTSDEKVEKFWRPIQTQTLIDDVKKSGGTLLYLASKQEQSAFNWKEVKKQVRVIDFEFLQNKNGKLRQVVIYTKMARGEMIAFMIKNKPTDPEELKFFEWGGYRYCEDLSTADKWVWVMD